MDNDKALNNVKAAIGLLQQLRKELEAPPWPAFKRGDISLAPGDSETRLFIHDGLGSGRWVSHPDNEWTLDSRELKHRVRVATRMEWAKHFPFEPYPYAPNAWRAMHDGRVAIIRRSTTGDGFLMTVSCLETRHRASLHFVKACAAEKLMVPDDVELKWEIVE